MHATLQVKTTIAKAQSLYERLDALKKAASTKRAEYERQLKKAKSEDQTAKLADQVRAARAIEKDVSITNLLRAMLDYAAENLLGEPDAELLAALHAVAAHRGRPEGAKEVGA